MTRSLKDKYIFCYRDQRVTFENLREFVDKKICSQFLRYDFHHSLISNQGAMWAYWKDRYGNKVNYWPGGEAIGRGCACGVDKSCAGEPKDLPYLRDQN